MVSFVLSQTVYVPVIARYLAEATGAPGACNQFMNVWGLVSAFAVIAFLVARYRATQIAVLGVGAVATAALWPLSHIERPSPVGCISALPAVSALSPYWWILVTFHVISSALAVVVLIRAALRSSGTDRSLSVGLATFGLAFVASTVFWSMQGVTLIDRTNALGAMASTSVFPLTVLLTSAALVVVATDQIVTLVRTGHEVEALWSRWLEQEAVLNPTKPVPRRRDVVGPWISAPAESVHQLRMQVADNDLVLASETRTMDSAN